jgi:hypothetical protein
MLQFLIAQDFSPPADVINAAHANFVAFLTSAVSEDTKTLAGFDADDDLTKAVPGTPFRMYYLSADSILSYNGNAPVESIVNESDMWYFPIIIDGKIKLMLYVGNKNGRWMRAGLGSAGLARQIQEITRQWPLKDGFTPLIVHQQDVGVYFFSIPQIDNANLTETGSITPSGTSLNKRLTQLKPLRTTIDHLCSRISR